MNKPQIYLDCDGVLADFDTFITPYMGGGSRLEWDVYSQQEFWDRLDGIDDLFGSLDKLQDADILVKGVEELCKLYDLNAPIILTGKPRKEKYTKQKLHWRDENFPHLEMIVCLSKDKCKYIKTQGDIIIDDWEKHMQAWIDAGGKWILHKSASQSLSELQEILEGLYGNGTGTE